METKFTRRLYGFVLAVLLIPIGQSTLGYFDESKLVGIEEESLEPRFSLTNWFNGSYQDSSLKYTAQSFGFRGWFVRLNNQIAYSFYNESRANNVTICADGYLTDVSHSDAYTGEDYSAASAVLLMERLRKLKYLQERWKEKGIVLVLTVQSGKGYYFPDKIQGQPSEGQRTLYKLFQKESRKNGLNFMDLSTWLRTEGRASGLPLYNRSGIHWTAAGAWLAGDTLVGYISDKLNNSMTKIEVSSVEWTYTPRFGEETDVFDGMNLLISPPREKYAYPSMRITPGTLKPKLLTVADSYYFMLSHAPYFSSTFDDIHFAFYYKELQTPQGVKDLKNFDLLREIESRDVILISSCDANLANYGWGFIEAAYSLYTDKRTEKYAIEHFEKGIRNDAAWMEVMAKKAQANGVSIDEMVREDAQYLWKTARIR